MATLHTREKCSPLNCRSLSVEAVRERYQRHLSSTPSALHAQSEDTCSHMEEEEEEEEYWEHWAMDKLSLVENSCCSIHSLGLSSCTPVRFIGLHMVQEPLYSDLLLPSQWLKVNFRGSPTFIGDGRSYGVQVVRCDGGSSSSLTHTIMQSGLQERALGGLTQHTR